jgi:hypothetical protein
MTFILTTFKAIESFFYYVFIHRDKLFILFICIYIGIFCIEVLCYNYLLNYAHCMNGSTDNITSTFVARNGTGKAVTCESIAKMLKHVHPGDSATVQIPTGKGQIIDSNTYAQPVRQYTRTGHHVIDLSQAPWYAQAGSYLCPNVEACTTVDGTAYTHILKKK